jgi:hypothetical protein
MTAGATSGAGCVDSVTTLSGADAMTAGAGGVVGLLVQLAMQKRMTWSVMSLAWGDMEASLEMKKKLHLEVFSRWSCGELIAGV